MTTMDFSRGWADEEEDDTFLPPKSVVGPDEKGIKTVTEYRKEKNQRVKVCSLFIGSSYWFVL